MKILSEKQKPSKWLPLNMKRELIANGFRDFFWTEASAININIRGRRLPLEFFNQSIGSIITNKDFVQPLLAAWLYSSIPMFFIAAVETFMRRGDYSLYLVGLIWAPGVSASLSCLTWTLGLAIGESIGTTSNRSQRLYYGSSIRGGVLAAIFCGLFEGFTQWSVKYLIDLATNKQAIRLWKNKPELI